MADNYLEILALQPILFIAEMMHKTQVCGLVWEQSGSAYTTTFAWDGDEYTAYLTAFQNAQVLDIIKDGQNVLSFNSYTNDQILELYQLVSTPPEIDPLIQIISDLNTILPCQKNIKIGSSGGLLAGGSALIAKVKVSLATGGVLVGGTALNAIEQPIGGLVAGGSGHVSGSGLTYAISGGAVVGGSAFVNAPVLLYALSGGQDLLSVTFQEDVVFVKTLPTQVYSMDLDFQYGKFFYGTPDGIAISDLDGIGFEYLLRQNSNYALTTALDKVNQKVYWVCQVSPGFSTTPPPPTYEIRRVNYDGTNPTVLTTFTNSPAPTIVDITGIDVDPVTSQVFWTATHRDPTNNFVKYSSVYRCGYDGTGLAAIRTRNVVMWSVAVVGSKIYVGGSGYFELMNLDGTSPTALSMTGLSVIADIKYNEKLYICDSGVKKVLRSETDLTNLEVLAEIDLLTNISLPR